jgi:hypothetical protein
MLLKVNEPIEWKPARKAEASMIVAGAISKWPNDVFEVLGVHQFEAVVINRVITIYALAMR